MEIQVSKPAYDKIIEEAKKRNTELTVRIYAEKIICTKARFGIAFDDERDDDEITYVNNIIFFTDRKYVPFYCDGLSIDYVSIPKEGFIISSLRTFPIKCSGKCCKCKNNKCK
jgi:Fe-S cluster assembly iron-binding protein IscA